MNTVHYEWDVETVDEWGDIVDHWFVEGAQDALEYSRHMANTPDTTRQYRIVVVRDDRQGRSWAYVDENNALPSHFCDAYDLPVARVPNRFHVELQMALDTTVAL